MLPEECKRRYNIKLWKQPLPEIGKCLECVLRHISGVKWIPINDYNEKGGREASEVLLLLPPTPLSERA